MKLKQNNGFLLVEIIIVLAVLTVLLMNLSSVIIVQSDNSLMHQAQKMTEFFLRLTHQAQVQKKTITVTLDTKTNSYSIHDMRYRLSPGLNFGSYRAVMGPPSAPFHAISDPISFKNHEIIFRADGTISAGTLYLTNSSGSCYALTHEVGDGHYFRIYHYHNGSWNLL